MSIEQESAKTRQAMKKVSIFSLFVFGSLFCGFIFAGSTTPLPTSSILRAYDSRLSQYVHTALLVNLTADETNVSLLNANMKCISYFTHWSGRSNAWDFNLISAYEVYLMNTPWTDLQEVLKHLPEVHSAFCPFPLHSTQPSASDIAETLRSIVRRPFISADSINQVDGPLTMRVVLGSNDIFFADSLGSMVTHIGGTVLLRPSLRRNESHLKICAWDHSVYNANFPASLDPTRYENRRLCQILNRSVSENISFHASANEIAIPENPF